MLFPQGTQAVEALKWSRYVYNQSGRVDPNVPDMMSSDMQIPGVSKARETRQFVMGPRVPPVDPMSRHKAIGSFFIMPGASAYADDPNPERQKHYRTNQCEIKRYRASNDDAYQAPFRETLEATVLYDKNKLITAVGRFYFNQPKQAPGSKKWSEDHYWAPNSEDYNQTLRDRRANKASELAHRTATDRNDSNVQRVAQYYESIGRLSHLKSFLHLRYAEHGPRMEEDFVAKFEHKTVGGANTARSVFSHLRGDYRADKTTDDAATAALMAIPLTRSDWFDFCMDYDIPIYIQIAQFVHQQTWKTGTAIMIGNGAGKTHVGGAKFISGSNPKTDTYFGSFGIHFKSIVENERNVTRAADAYVTNFISGDNGNYFMNKNEQKQQMSSDLSSAEGMKTTYAIALPYHWRNANNFMDMTGQYARSVVTNSTYHYPTAPAYKIYWGWSDPVVQHWGSTLGTARAHSGRNTIMAQGFQINFNAETDKNGTGSHGAWSNLIYDKGHKGEHWGPGSAARKQDTQVRIALPFAYQNPNQYTIC